MKTKHFIGLAICFFLSLVIFYGMGWIDGRKAMAKELILIKARQDTTNTNFPSFNTNDMMNGFRDLEDALENINSNKWYLQRHPNLRPMEI